MMPVPYLSHKEKEWAYAMWCNGHTKKQIANALYVHEKTVARAIGNRPRIRPVLKYEEKK